MKQYQNDGALLTDLYELTMLEAYHFQRMNGTAVFEFFVRCLPPSRNFLVSAGLEQVMSYLAGLRFDDEDLTWLRRCGKFSEPFIASLCDFRFTGDVDAMPEGTIFFPGEPILRITAPLREAQFVESRVMNLLHFQTLIASKAVRSVMAANGRLLVDFGLRRAHGAEAAVLSARASYLAGFDGTATTQGNVLFGIPVFGTMAHSFIQAFESEADAFAAFARSFPNNATLLIDTYDTEAGAHQVARLAQWLREDEGIHIKAVRLDSGDLGQLARRVRKILDDGGCNAIEVFASGNLDEHAVENLIGSGAPIDGFGIGTRMNTSADSPFLDCAFKLAEYAGRPSRKRSLGKATWPGRKQVWRQRNSQGVMCRDVLGLDSENMGGEALLQPVMRAGTLLQPLPPLSEIRTHVRQQLSILPTPLRDLGRASPYPLQVSDVLQATTRQVDIRQREQDETDKARWGFDEG